MKSRMIYGMVRRRFRFECDQQGGRYALRVMLDLAQHPDEGYISLKTIADRQRVSMKYLEIIVSSLKKAGLVDSTRGKGGRL